LLGLGGLTIALLASDHVQRAIRRPKGDDMPACEVRKNDCDTAFEVIVAGHARIHDDFELRPGRPLRRTRGRVDPARPRLNGPQPASDPR
jgi:hypothetical protein